MKMKISTKLFAGLGILLFMVIVMAGEFYWSMENVEQEEERVLQLSKLNAFFSDRIGDHLRWVNELSSGLFLQGKEFKGKLDPDECNLGKWMLSFKPYSNEIAEPFEALDEPHRKLHVSAVKIISSFKAGDKEMAHTIFISETMPAAIAVQENLKKMKDIIEKDVDITDRQLQAHIRKTNVISIGLVIFILSFTIVSGIIFIKGITKGITEPLEKMVNAMKRIAEGDLTCEVAVKGSDEVVHMAEEFNKVVKGLKALIINAVTMTNSVSGVTEGMSLSSSKVLKGADMQHDTIEKTARFIEEIDNSISSVSMSAESLSTSAEETSSSVIEMATSVEKVAASANSFSVSASDAASSIEEMVASIKEISESLENLSASSEETASSLDEINASVKEVEHGAVESVSLAERVTSDASDKGMNAANAAIKGMDEIKESVGSIAEAIHRLGKRSDEIGQIMTVIADVTDQTSLLALNAAILAAQAGEHGAGFAVVADEIKGLAGKTAGSTKEIAALIESVQADTKLSVEMAEKGIQSVETGVRLVREVNGALRSIVNSSQTSTEKAKLIQKATTEEAEVIKHITAAIKNISEQIEYISKATKEQSKGSMLIMEAIERIKELSQHVKDATNEQSIGSKQISSAIGNVSDQAEQIAKATAIQSERSKKIVESIGSVKKIAGESVSIANDMSAAIKSLEEEARKLISELQRFKV